MAQPHELPDMGFEPVRLTDWRIDPRMSDAEILQHLDSIQRPFSAPATIGGVVNGVLINGELVLNYRRVHKERENLNSLLVTRRSDIPVVARRRGEIFSKFSIPRDSDFSTVPVKNAEGDVLTHIGDKYVVRFFAGEGSQGIGSRDISIASTEPILPQYVPDTQEDHQQLLRTLARYLS
jgi:hypothetical protein